jgi:hypothetical protein
MKKNTFKAMLLVMVILAASVVPALADAVGGPKYGTYRLGANRYRTFSVSFYGGQTARVVVSGDGDTDLDLYVYDVFGNLIASDDDELDDCVVSWTPRWTGNFTIKVVNRGIVYNDFVLATN